MIESMRMSIVLSPQAEDVLKRIMKKYSYANYSEAIEHLCGFYEAKDK